MQLNTERIKRIGFQFFADPQQDPSSDPPKGDPNGGQQGGSQQQDPPAGKTYTQEQINTMMANEKRTARQAILKELGFDLKDEKSYKDTLKSIKDTLDAGKTQAQKDSEAKAAAESAKAEAETKAAMLEMKVAALSAGVNPDYLDDVITLAQSKVTDSNPIDKVMTDLKAKYPSFFAASSGSKGGTGSSNNPPRKTGTGDEGLGARLAKSSKPATKSSYFKN